MNNLRSAATALACVLLSALGFYFSLGLGNQWWLAWIAPVPVLWFAFGNIRPGAAFLAAFISAALGGCSILRAYAGLLPPSVLASAIGGFAVTFAFSVLAARRVERRLGPIAGMTAFAAVWTAFDFLASFTSDGGSASTPAGAEVGAPFLIQSAALVGFLGLTFLLGLVAAGIALSLRRGNILPVALAAAVFVVNAAYGSWRMSAPPAAHIRVALIDSNDTMGPVRRGDRIAALKDIDAYALQIGKLRTAHVQLIVLPENIAQIAPEWRAEAQAKLAAAARETGATLVAGFNTAVGGDARNVSWAFMPGNPAPVTYIKRRLVPVLETRLYRPGSGPGVLGNGIGLEICKDMDFQAMLRADERATRPMLLAVPAWDFDRDDWFHARVAILRSVENGVPMARTARDGLLTLNDRYGRIVAAARTRGGFRTLIGNLPLDGKGGGTLYDKIGDVLGWFCLLLGALLIGWSFTPASRRASQISK
ncbi:MAG TPA: nitrilase-related carbon-nitrogen hydrolase [Rhizomicrobium sp.]|nr:nitrilase-related carbon-nitrogen hydrolase [Rhizomicrobium sp.]